jgi:amino acid transporter
MSITASPSHAGETAEHPKGVADTGFHQRLGLFDATMLVAGTMIGSGIFIVSADIARDVGSSGWLLAVWALTGVMTIVGALCYAELAAMMPHAGGQYVFLREAYSPLGGFLYGWTSFVVIQTGTSAAVGVAFAKFLGVLDPRLGTGEEAELFRYTFDVKRVIDLPLPWLATPLRVFERSAFTITTGQVIAVAIIAFLSLLNCRGVHWGKWVQNVFGVAKTAALLGLIIVGLTLAASPRATETNLKDVWGGITQTRAFEATKQLTGSSGILVALMVAGGAMVGALFSADAWGNVTYTAAEVKHPKRNLPRSLMLGTAIVILLYLLANVAYLCDLPIETDDYYARSVAVRFKHLRAESNGARAQSVLYESSAKLLEADADLARFLGDSDKVKKHLEEAENERSLAAKWKGIAVERRHAGEELYAKETREIGLAHARDDRVGTAVMQLVWPRWGPPIMAIAIMLSTFGCLNGLLLMGARLYYAMSVDGLFFRSVGYLNARGVPAVGLILQGLWASLLVFSGTYGELLDYVILAALLFYAFTVGGLFILRWKLPNAERPYRVLGYPVLPGLYLVLCVLLMVDLLIVRPVYTWPGLILVLAGIPVYFFWRWRSQAAGPVLVKGQ